MCIRDRSYCECSTGIHVASNVFSDLDVRYSLLLNTVLNVCSLSFYSYYRNCLSYCKSSIIDTSLSALDVYLYISCIISLDSYRYEEC